MSTTETQLPIQAGDLLVEIVGNESRIFQVGEDGKKVKLLARSFVFFKQRMIQWEGRTEHKACEASDFTSAKLYNKKDRKAGALLVKKYFPEATRVHFFYAGHGPSGSYWNFYPNSHYSFDV